MGVPSISVRKHVRLIPDKAEEPTSTIVLTSKASHYVDIRIYKAALEKDQDSSAGHREIILEWAFAGKSQTSKEIAGSSNNEPYHAVWEHWIDSKSNNPPPDEGDMLPQPNGDLLEQGSQIHPVTGLLCEYEELWGDLDVEIVGEEVERVSLALKLEDEDNHSRGMIVRVGSWCQGILRVGGEITIERWQAKDVKSGEWSLVKKIGGAVLPCERLFNVEGLEKDFSVELNESKWTIIEKYHW